MDEICYNFFFNLRLCHIYVCVCVCVCECVCVKKKWNVENLAPRMMFFWLDLLDYQKLFLPLPTSHTYRNTSETPWRESKAHFPSVNKYHFYPMQGSHTIVRPPGSLWICWPLGVRISQRWQWGPEQRGQGGRLWMYGRPELVQRNKYRDSGPTSLFGSP